MSRKLLARDTFKPATTLNLLAAAWIQFQVHDWFEHDSDEKRELEVPIAEDDRWPHRPMRVQRTLHSSPGVPGKEPPSFSNIRSHWWDASQLYGDDRQTCESLRSHQGGKLLIGEDRLLPLDPRTHIDRSGMTSNWWLGLSLLHTLFTLEHNAICERLQQAHPDASDEELYQRARLVNCALLAKIHTVEWTPAILGHPVVKIAMNANWAGIATQKVSGLLKAIHDPELQHGIPGSETNQDGVDYALTEEFAAVYRLHPLIPDELSVRSLSDPHLHLTKSMLELAGARAREVQEAVSMEDLFYSFGLSHPGAITLHNYPDFLRNLQPLPRQGRPTAPGPIDLATIDILRDRERGVPRYNAFRHALRMPRVKSFAQLTSNETWRKELEELYGDIDRLDLMVGLFAEEPPPGFGFSDTAFRVFILMASRRLKSDRFFTSDYNASTYTQTGLDWIADNTMRTVLMRHYPSLKPVLEGVENAFAPWPGM
ncbi:peroxidase family protein [Cystobacter fuscus]